MAGRGSVHGLSSLQKAALILGVPAAATVMYILYRRYRESRESRVLVVAEEGLEVGVRIPRSALRALIGPRGSTINQLRQETGAQIDVEEREDREEREEREEPGRERGRCLVRISGSPRRVCRARAAVLRIATESATVSERLSVPQRAVGRIIGRGGDTVRSICRSSGARVECGAQDAAAGLAPVRTIRLLGTRREVEAAKKLILEKLSEDRAFRRELAQAAAARCPRKQPLGVRREPPGAGNGVPGVPGAPGVAGCPEGWRECWDVEWEAAGDPGAAAESEGMEPGSDSGEPGDDTEEPGNGIEEPGNGNEEPGNGIGEPGNGSEEPGNWNEEPGNGIEEPGDGTEEPGNGIGEPGNWNEEPGDGTEEPGNGIEEPGNWIEEPGDGTEEPWEPPVPKFEVPSPDFSFPADEHLDVYVSAAESPGRFWIQLLGTRSLQLDRLTAGMGHFYRDSRPVPPPSLQPGAIVAAPSPAAGEWHRARVLGPAASGHLRLRYLDFGDSGRAPPEALRALRSDFLSLPFQAIECGLAGIVPNGPAWPEAALAEFERLTLCAQWAPLVARIQSYSRSGGCARPRVRLFTQRQGQILDVGSELVRLGFAVPGPPEEPPDNLGCASIPSPAEPGSPGDNPGDNAGDNAGDSPGDNPGDSPGTP